MDKQQQILNWKADRLEGMIYQCGECEHVPKAEVSKHYSSDDYDKSLPCKCKDCKYKMEHQEILKSIKARTQTL